MKNTLIGVVLLSIVWLSSCGGTSSPEKNISTSSPSTGVAISHGNGAAVTAENAPASTEPENVIQLTNAMFLDKVYDYKKNPDKWTFKGNKPCVIDFYADWCRPCKMVAPIMSELSEKYKGQIIIYRVNTDKEPELSQFFGIRSIPTVFFCPSTGDPQMTQGALPKETFEKIITEVLLGKK